MEKIIYENNSITITSGNTPTIFYFSDEEQEWYQVIDIENTDGFISFMDDVRNTYDAKIEEQINDVFTKIFEEDL